jgi:DNA-binding beta-propeller fold protein YncE
MNTRTTTHGLRAIGLALIAAFVVCAPAHAHGGGRFGAIGHAGGFGFHGGVVRGFAGFRGGFGIHGGFGCCFWPGYGLFLGTLPFYYSILWWNGVPYYYADDNYYVWNNSMGAYQAVAPPPRVMNQAAAQWGGTDLFAYPKNGQSAEQQARDRQECRNRAASPTGSGTTPAGAAPGVSFPSAAAASPSTEENLRAQAACLEGRGYSVK